MRHAPLLLWLGACGGEISRLDHSGDDSTPLPGLSLGGVVPSEGSELGGTSVVLSGAGFTEGTTVRLGQETCGALTLVSSAELTCVTSGGSPGEVELLISRAEDGATVTSTFRYLEDGGGDGTGTDDTGTGGTGADDTGTGGTGTDDTGGDTTTAIPVNYCHLQWPCTLTAAPGASTDPLYVWVYQTGITEGAGQGGGLAVEVGVGPDGSDPGAGGWTWTAAAYNADKDGLVPGDLANDEYLQSFVAPTSTGDHDYCGRASADGGVTWTLCDLGGEGCGGAGSTDGYDPAAAGSLTVE